VRPLPPGQAAGSGGPCGRPWHPGRSWVHSGRIIASASRVCNSLRRAGCHFDLAACPDVRRRTADQTMTPSASSAHPPVQPATVCSSLSRLPVPSSAHAPLHVGRRHRQPSSTPRTASGFGSGGYPTPWSAPQAKATPEPGNGSRAGGDERIATSKL